MDPRLVHDVQAAESCKLVAYRDIRGFWTIGWGHLLPAAHDWTGLQWTQETADAQLQSDLQVAKLAALNSGEWVALDTPCRENAVTELIFNMGAAHWLGFQRTRSAIRRKDWQAAHDGLLDSAWAVEVGPHRSLRIAGYLLSGSY